MKLKVLRELFGNLGEDKEIDVEIGNRLIPIVGIEPSGECGTGLKLVLAKECKVCDAKDSK